MAQKSICRDFGMVQKPMDMLDQSLDQVVLIKLRGGREFRGVLRGYDVHMNLILDEAEEINREDALSFVTVIIRGDNVVFISPSETR
jgi:small nuclear ribonucleoprotein (snRNP)-like protein